MNFCITHNLHSSFVQMTSLDAIVDAMRNSERLKEAGEEFRRKVGDKGRKKVKVSEFPAFFPFAFFNGGKSKKEMTGLTGFGAIDIDHIEDNQMIELIDKLKSDLHTVLAARSVSQKGIHVLFRYAFDGMEMPDGRSMTQNRMEFTFRCVVKMICRYYNELLGVAIDKNCLNIERQMIISHDADLFYNKAAAPFLLEYVQYPVKRYGVKAFRMVEGLAGEDSVNNMTDEPLTI